MQIVQAVVCVEPSTSPLADDPQSRLGERAVSGEAPQGRSDPLSFRIEKLALEKRDAVRRRDWPAARSAAEEKTVLQEARHRAAARRLA